MYYAQRSVKRRPKAVRLNAGLARTACLAAMQHVKRRRWRGRRPLSGPGRAFRRMTIDTFWRCATSAASMRDTSNATNHNELTARRSTAARSAIHKLTLGLSIADARPEGNWHVLLCHVRCVY